MLNEEIIDTMLRMAKDAKQRSFISSDKGLAGACVLTTDGTLYAACTLENSTGEKVCCAPRVAISKAIADSKLDFDALVVFCESEKEKLCEEALDLIKEFDIPDVVIGTIDGVVKAYTAEELLK